MNQNPEKNLSFDIKRSIILAEYIKCWGMPEARELMPYDNESKVSMPVELYIFPGEDMDQVTRIATIGLSSCKFQDDKRCNSELLMVLPFDIADEQWDAISRYVFDISRYLINTLGHNVKSADLLPESDLAPDDWPQALLFDDPRGEPNELNYFHIGMQHVTLSWVVPVFASECDLIKNSGIEAFDTAVDHAEVSLVEVRRDACV
jgi:hypothetical protein